MYCTTYQTQSNQHRKEQSRIEGLPHFCTLEVYNKTISNKALTTGRHYEEGAQLKIVPH